MAVYLSTLRSVNVDFLAQTRDFRKYCIPSEGSSALIKMFTIDQVLSVEARQKEQNNFITLPFSLIALVNENERGLCSGYSIFHV